MPIDQNKSDVLAVECAGDWMDKCLLSIDTSNSVTGVAVVSAHLIT